MYFVNFFLQFSPWKLLKFFLVLSTKKTINLSVEVNFSISYRAPSFLKIVKICITVSTLTLIFRQERRRREEHVKTLSPTNTGQISTRSFYFLSPSFFMTEKKFFLRHQNAPLLKYNPKNFSAKRLCRRLRNRKGHKLTFLILHIGTNQARFLWGPWRPNMKNRKINWASSLRLVALFIVKM